HTDTDTQSILTGHHTQRASERDLCVCVSQGMWLACNMSVSEACRMSCVCVCVCVCVCTGVYAACVCVCVWCVCVCVCGMCVCMFVLCVCMRVCESVRMCA